MVERLLVLSQVLAGVGNSVVKLQQFVYEVVIFGVEYNLIPAKSYSYC
jgi:hypothetical protein